jgi:hypothetical protein
MWSHAMLIHVCTCATADFHGILLIWDSHQSKVVEGGLSTHAAYSNSLRIPR